MVPSDSISHLTSLHRTLSSCSYVSDYSTLAMFPKPVVRAGLYSEEMGGFYKEIAEFQWHTQSHPNGSVTYSYHSVSFEVRTFFFNFFYSCTYFLILFTAAVWYN